MCLFFHRYGLLAWLLIGLIVIPIMSATDTLTTTPIDKQTSVVSDLSTVGARVSMADNSVSTRNVADNEIYAMCPNMVQYVFENAVPHDKIDAGKFVEYKSPVSVSDELDLHGCVLACCAQQHICNLVFVFKEKCYHVHCKTNEGCLPTKNDVKKQAAEGSAKDHVQMILVNTVSSGEGTEDDSATWLDVLKSSKSSSTLMPVEENIPLSFWKQPHKFHYPQREQDVVAYDDEDFPFADKRVKQMLLSSAVGSDVERFTPEELAFFGANLPADTAPLSKYLPCDLSLTGAASKRCPPRQECVSGLSNSETGICKCRSGFVRSPIRGECMPREMDYQSMEDSASVPHNHILPISALDIPPATDINIKKEDEQRDAIVTATNSESNLKLVVSVVSKEVRLPEKEVTLSAFTVPDEQSSDTTYKYLWTLISQPKGPMNGTISDQSKSKVKLSNLSEGLYTFKVSVTGANGTSGEAMANVTVIPEKRVNRIPQVVITPAKQEIRQPITNTVLDGSTSSDDDKIIAWHWDLISGPIGYQPQLPEVNTLQLSDLTAPGNYTFKLTVTDSDNVKNSTMATITVLKATDYPPVANAGEAVILYLPNNNVTLNGSASSDDHDIVAWEWTKDASDETKAVDMQHTRTPFLQLSNLEEGMYTFVLKVTDISGQSSTANVHVFVKPPTNSPPTATANGNLTISLPQNWAMLNGSSSVDDIRIKNYMWRQVSGPNTAVISHANESVANATSLTLGLYVFQLSVIDENNNTGNDTTWIKVVQEKNAAPVANAGGDQSVTLPLSALYLNGSKSSDDLAVVKYVWTRDETSLAAGLVVGNTDNEPVLILTNLVHGRYVYKLTVSDDQGLTSADTVSIIVHPDPLIPNLVQLTLPMGISVLTQSELNSIVQKIGLLLSDMKVNVRELKYETRTEGTILVIYIESVGADGKTNIVDGLTVERLLKTKLQQDASMLGTVFVDVRTTICQYNCSGHGSCNAETRACICEAFWMPSLGYFLSNDEANCNWSILYVFVGIIVGFMLLSGIFWGIAFACRRSRINNKKPRSRPKVQKYSLLDTQDVEAPHAFRPTSFTDSETDSDVLFESRSKQNGILRMNGTSPKNRQKPKKIGRKIKA